MKVAVEKSHIQNGVERDSTMCMIADAIKSKRPSLKYVTVDVQSIRFTDLDKGKRYVFLTPPVAQRNLLRFDQGKPVQPFTFSLAEPAVERTIEKRSGKGWEARKAANARKKSAAHKKKYAYLAANRARYQQREREFGLKKFVA